VVEDLTHEDFRGSDAALSHRRKEMRGVKLHGAGLVGPKVVKLLANWDSRINRWQAVLWALPFVLGNSRPQEKQRACAGMAGQLSLHARGT
jgi:hypothetical protein